MKRRRQLVFKIILFILFILQLFHLIYRVINYTNHYPILIGVYCFDKKFPLGYIENKNINDELNIRKCSLVNIDACQRISNQTLLFRLHWYAGFTSELNNLIRAFIYAINKRRRFLIDDQYWNYGSFSSYFNISQGHFSPWLPSSTYCLQREFIHLINYEENKKYIPQHLTVARDISGGFSTLNIIMKSLEEKSNQTLKIKRIVAQYLWKTLNNDIRDFINQYMKKIFVDNITYAMHIRRGDKLKEEAKLISIEKYIDGIEYFMKKNLQNELKPRIYVASDQYNIIDQLRYIKPNWEFVQFSQIYLPLNDHRQKLFNHLPIHSKLESTRILLTDIEILTRIKYVVCTFSSNICRFIQILRKQQVDTVLSLDEEWYPQ